MSINIIQNINLIKNQIENALKKSTCSGNIPRLVAVSKFKPIEDIISAYQCGLRFFGENYIKELEGKANDKELMENCPDIRWHFIGKIQSNKINHLLKIPNLDVIETVSSRKIADLINSKLIEINREDRLKVMIQVNTSGKDVKNGISPEDVVEISLHIHKSCDKLKLTGFMTIGDVEYVSQNDPNPDFVTLVKCREQVCQSLNLPTSDFELSMGMSNDFEHAISMGSTNVRIGSSIFGSRDTKM